ncbi:MAG: hypothetical protein KIT17_18690 [Rubrivivax sp.]|nr:hypothetical protein [Rubrivivax sp.]
MPIGLKRRRHWVAGTLLACNSAVAFAQESSSFMLPNFSTPDYECDGLRRATLQRQPIDGKDAYAVVLHDRGGAEFQGDLAGMVGWKAGSTVTFVGTITVNSCNPSGPTAIVINGDWLKFLVSADRRLVYMEGAGTVTQGQSVTKLPIGLPTPPALPSKPARAKPSARPASR